MGRSAAGFSRFFWFCRDISSSDGAAECFNTHQPLSFVHVSVQEQVTRSCLAGVQSVHVLSLTAHGVIHKRAWVPLGHFQTLLWSSRAVVLGGWSHSWLSQMSFKGFDSAGFVPEVSLALSSSFSAYCSLSARSAMSSLICSISWLVAARVSFSLLISSSAPCSTSSVPSCRSWTSRSSCSMRRCALVSSCWSCAACLSLSLRVEMSVWLKEPVILANSLWL